MDECTRECRAIEVAPSIGGGHVVETLKWLARAGCGTIFITPGSPWESPYIESFTGKLRDEYLNCEIFAGLEEARMVIEDWRAEYNTVRPHSSLGRSLPPPPPPHQPWAPRPSGWLAFVFCVSCLFCANPFLQLREAKLYLFVTRATLKGAESVSHR